MSETHVRQMICQTVTVVLLKEMNLRNDVFPHTNVYFNVNVVCKNRRYSCVYKDIVNFKGMCAWNNHYCWPGNCGANGLTQDCACAPYFRKVSTPGAAINSGETTCQPTQTPSIFTCDTVTGGRNGDRKRAMSLTASTACEHLQDMYGNFQPSIMEFDMVSDLTIDITSIARPAFIAESYFGISDSTIRINHMTVNSKYL